MKFTIIKKILTVVILIVSLSTICISSVSAAPVTDSVIYFQEYNPNVRGTSAPSKNSETNLSNNPHELQGYFKYLAYSDCCFRPDGNGEIDYYVAIDYRNIDVFELGEGWNMRKSLKVELWEMDNGILDLDGDTLVYTHTEYAPFYGNTTDSYYDFVINSETISDLDPLKLYYMVIIKTNDGLDADISGSIGHP